MINQFDIFSKHKACYIIIKRLLKEGFLQGKINYNTKFYNYSTHKNRDKFY